jgi:hypothetical protein
MSRVPGRVDDLYLKSRWICILTDIAHSGILNVGQQPFPRLLMCRLIFDRESRETDSNLIDLQDFTVLSKFCAAGRQ